MEDINNIQGKRITNDKVINKEEKFLNINYDLLNKKRGKKKKRQKIKNFKAQKIKVLQNLSKSFI